MVKKRAPQFATADVVANSHDGRGIAKIHGKTVFISGALAGETVVFQYTRQKSQFDEGEVREISIASPERQQPRCQHFGVCGGCQLQHLNTPSQLKLKQQMLLEQLQHQANTQPVEILDPISANEWGYRRKARLGVKYVAGKNKVLVGFRERDARFIANLNRCEILHSSVGACLDQISETLYQLETRDKIPQIELAVDDNKTALIFRNLVALPERDLEILKQFAQQQGYKLYLQPKGPDSVYLVYPDNDSDTMQYTLPNEKLTFAFHPVEFTQINAEINQQLVTKTLELLQITSQDQILDLFCGIGNFSLAIAKYAGRVVGVEGSAAAVSRAITNASVNGLKNVEFYEENLFEPPFQPLWCQRQYNKLVLDPPRSGAKEIVPLLAVWQPEKIVYISCNPATLARDSGLILQQGYRLVKAGIANMFPHTRHVEAIALFEKTGEV